MRKKYRNKYYTYYLFQVATVDDIITHEYIVVLFKIFQFGIAVGFVVPPILIKWGNTEEDGLRLIYYGVAVITTVILLLICLCKYQLDLRTRVIRKSK